MKLLKKCLFGPKLYRRHRFEGKEGRDYEANAVESFSGKAISFLRFWYSFTYWTSPFVLGFLYRRGYFTVDGCISLAKFGLYLSITYGIAWFFRGVGRCYNLEYITFITLLSETQKTLTHQNRRLLSKYDFEFKAWPVDFRWSDVNSGGAKRTVIQIPVKSRRKTVTSIPCDILGYICAYTFGQRMMYPGSTALFNSLLFTPLLQGRAKMIEEKGGIRAKVETEDKNGIDTIFLDRRSVLGQANSKGNILVLCCEGNAGFYEIGCTVTPMEAGYSVLGWNHPGFAGSSGKPKPAQEQKAVDAVMQYAIHKLGFTPDRIWLFGWSIGGYDVSWAAMNYPDVKCVTLDASFDDVLPLALTQMPSFAESLVTSAIKSYLNLNVLEQICRYPGPIHLIRRTQDEVITTYRPTPGESPVNALKYNRGNFLLLGILKHRYPNLIDESTTPVVLDWLSRRTEGQILLYSEHVDNEAEIKKKIASYMENNSETFPLNIGEDYSPQEKLSMILFLAMKYMSNFDTTHCTPLPADKLVTPWSITSDSS